MKYTLTQLASIVDKHNRNALAMLASARPALFASPAKLPSTPIIGANVQSVLPSHSLGSWSGFLSGNAVPTYDFVRAALDLNGHGDIAAVFSVVEDIAAASLDPTKEMPVALCVGINYGQGPLFLAPLPLRSVTGMLPFAKLAIPKATGIPLVPFHLVAANFFPWITLDEWSLTVTNALKEHLLLETCGFADPVKHISSLVALLQPEWLIFHGVGCCVPSLGMKVRNALYRETIFCDNLSGPPTSNAIVY